MKQKMLNQRCNEIFLLLINMKIIVDNVKKKMVINNEYFTKKKTLVFIINWLQDYFQKFAATAAVDSLVIILHIVE